MRIESELTDGVVNLMRERLDFAVRLRELPDSDQRFGVDHGLAPAKRDLMKYFAAQVPEHIARLLNQS